jgi:sterol desaturase/sphingolipid hydroxylase (fatty acid hydroxylase superfamily)
MRESKRMFENDLFERFSRIPPWQPPVIYLPLIVILSVVGLGRKGVALPAFAALVLAGLLAWTLMEYWLHRALFHHRPRTSFGRRLFWIMHGVHHDWPNDPLRLVFPPAVSIPLAVGFWMLFTRIAGDAFRYPLMIGLVCGYLAYDMVHYWLHHATPKSRLGMRLRRHHLSHHFQDDGRGFGVSSPLWDYVFGTVR